MKTYSLMRYFLFAVKNKSVHGVISFVEALDR